MTKSRNNNEFSSKKLDTNLLIYLQQQGKSERYIVKELAKRGIKTSKSTVHRRLHACVSKGGGISKHHQKNQKKLDERAVRRISIEFINKLNSHYISTSPFFHLCVCQVGA